MRIKEEETHLTLHEHDDDDDDDDDDGSNSLPTCRDNLSVPSSRVKNLKVRPVGCPRTSVRNYHYLQRNSPEERSSHLRVYRCRSLKSRRVESTQASGGNSLPTFRDNLSVPSSRVKNLKTGPVGCPETSVRNYH